MKIFNQKILQHLPDAILFDTDNTLYPYEIANLKATEAVKNKVIHIFSVNAKDFDQAYIKAKNDIKNRLGNTASSHSRLLYLQRMLEIMGLGSQVLIALDLEQTYWRTFLSNAILFNGVKDLLEEIRLLGVPIAIVTDLTSQIQFRKMVYFGIDKFFDYIVTSEESGKDKPAEESFKLAIEKIKPKGNNFWMIGDHLVNDISGAKKSINASTFLKVDKINDVKDNEKSIDVIFDSYLELKTIILNILK